MWGGRGGAVTTLHFIVRFRLQHSKALHFRLKSNLRIIWFNQNITTLTASARFAQNNPAKVEIENPVNKDKDILLVEKQTGCVFVFM